jgi:hypothetical protein
LVIVYVEQEDCPPKYTPDMLAYLLLQSVKTMCLFFAKGDNVNEEEVEEAVVKAIKDFNERWERT